MDLTVDKYIVLEKEPKPGHGHTVDPYKQKSIDLMFDNPLPLPFPLLPGQRALLNTEEIIEVPYGKCGFIEIRSTWARLGLFCPPTVADPEFRGQLTLEVLNMSLYAIQISSGDRIWSMIHLHTDEPAYKGRYQNQSGIQLPKALRRD